MTSTKSSPDSGVKIIETSFFLDLLASDEGAIERAKDLENEEVPSGCQRRSYTIFTCELRIQSPEWPISNASRGCFAGRTIVETTEANAKRAGRVDGQLRHNGGRIPVWYLIIGATGLVFDEPELTRIANRFARIPNPKVDIYCRYHRMGSCLT